jgi:hypothetical protein
MAITLKGLLTPAPPSPGPSYANVVFTGTNLLTIDEMNNNFFYLRELALAGSGASLTLQDVYDNSNELNSPVDIIVTPSGPTGASAQYKVSFDYTTYGGDTGSLATINMAQVTVGGYAGDRQNTPYPYIAIGGYAGNNGVIYASGYTATIGEGTIAIGSDAAAVSSGFNVIGIGMQAAQYNSGNEVIALGTYAGTNFDAISPVPATVPSNTLDNVFIVSNLSLPRFANRAAAVAGLTGGATGTYGSTYLYYNEATFAIEGVRTVDV